MELLEPYNLPFAAALGVMMVLAVLQMVGTFDALGDAGEVGADSGIEADTAGHAGPVEGLVSLLGIGRVPFMVWLALLLLVFAGIGVSVQALAFSFTGGPLATALGALIAGGAALPVTGALARPLGAVLPHDETSAVPLDALLGRQARITDGVARAGHPARARVHDRHGTMHHVMVQPHDSGDVFHAGDEVLLVRREGEAFFATPRESRALSPS